MARVNSPGYPSMSLPKAIIAIRKIFEADRRNPVDRAVAARHMGYSGPSGASDKAIAALTHYGLSEKTGKGELRVSQRALDILHPDKPTDKQQAILAAGQNPSIFKVLHDRFGDHVSPDALKSYLVRENFQDAAIAPLMNAYFETRRYLEQEKAFESVGTDDEDGSEEALQPDLEHVEMTSITPQAPVSVALASAIPVAFASGSILNKVNMNVKGGQVHLEALLDRKGIAALKRKLASLEALLDDDEPKEDDGTVEME